MRSAYNTMEGDIQLNKIKSERAFLLYLVNEYLLSTYHVASIVLVVEDTPVNKQTKFLPSWSLYLNSI